MKKKFFALLLTASMTGSIFTVAADEVQAADAEVTHIVSTFLTMGTTPADLQEVQDAINEMTIPAIGVEVELYPLPLFDTFTKYPLLFSSGEDIDLACFAFTNLSNYADQGLIMPIDSYIETEAPYILSCIEDEKYPLFDGSYYMGEAYGVTPVATTYGTGGCNIFASEDLEAIGYTYEEGTVISLDELTELYAQLKELYPDSYPCGTITKGQATSKFGMFNGVYDTLGATASSGVFLGTESETVVDLFETEEYYEYLTYLKKWYDAGYIYTDASTTDSLASELLASGVLRSELMTSQPIMVDGFESKVGKKGTLVNLNEVYYTAQSSSSNVFWALPITCDEPEAAVRYLNYMYENPDMLNTLLWGIKGKHYVITDEENGIIGFPEGVDASNSGFYNTYGVFGDRRYELEWSLAAAPTASAEFSEKAMANGTKAIGYAYDTTMMGTQIANIDAVLAEYLPTLESGSASDLDALYKSFVTDLKAAGIDEVVADNQAQYDAWKAQ